MESGGVSKSVCSLWERRQLGVKGTREKKGTLGLIKEKGTKHFQAITLRKVVVHLCGWGLGDSSKETWAHLLLGSALPFLPQLAFPPDHSHLSRKPQGEKKKKNQISGWNISLWLICNTEINCNQCSMTPAKHSRQMNHGRETGESPTYTSTVIPVPSPWIC